MATLLIWDCLFGVSRVTLTGFSGWARIYRLKNSKKFRLDKSLWRLALQINRHRFDICTYFLLFCVMDFTNCNCKMQAVQYRLPMGYL
jgi:hypothetical protein